MHTEWNDDLRKALKRPFPKGAVKWKAQTTSRDETRALAVAFIDARNVMERLDRTVGPQGWSDEYEIIAATPGEYVVECRLSVLGVIKADVGDSSATSSNSKNQAKAAYSDALKRAAVKFGIGRYLYALPLEWVPYDSQRRRLAMKPELPSWAIPGDDEEVDESASFEEPEGPLQTVKPLQEEAPLKPREDLRENGKATRNPGEYVLTWGKYGKDGGNSLSYVATQDGGMEYLKRIADWEKTPKQIAVAVKTFLAWIERDESDSQSEDEAGNGAHWSESDVNRRRFWAQCNKMHVPASEVHEVLVGDSDGHLIDYPGNMGDALTMIREYAVEHDRIAR